MVDEITFALLRLLISDVEITNEGKQWCSINVRMIKCCETICPNDVECEHMQLIGGDMGEIAPTISRNVTLVWPTLYLHDRVGECVIAIGYNTKNNQTGEIHRRIKFDSSVSSSANSFIRGGYYGTANPRKCSTVDLDTLDDCRPVNCHVKYNGKRNFFNRRQQRCQPVPICIADATKDLPDVAYVPASNTCRDLENAVDEEEVRTLSQGVAEAAWRSEPLPYLSNVYCHHGSKDNATGFCVCHEGWTSQPVDNLEPSTERIHLCNVQMLPWPRLRHNRLKTILTIIAGLLGVLVVLVCCGIVYVIRGGRVPSSACSPDSANCTGRRDREGEIVDEINSCAPNYAGSNAGTCCGSDARTYKRFGLKTMSDISCSPTCRTNRY
ncbi:uncharacterized protein LOC105691068 isoform X3 [Athalia rosae]|uniref:uncharacterized protein LOC105691068 isoform X3 n=1 Tax=Athalia rosae TaxID=37344 RepID=UPI0020344969|nr:uncharacterized protein LOC105691068 isoform X3 [Athalia rosae]